jgi:hypothetical protein
MNLKLESETVEQIVEKTVFSPLLGQNFRKFINFPSRCGGGGGGGRPLATNLIKMVN